MNQWHNDQLALCFTLFYYTVFFAGKEERWGITLDEQHENIIEQNPDNFFYGLPEMKRSDMRCATLMEQPQNLSSTCIQWQ
jgi:hypothetical protein